MQSKEGFLNYRLGYVWAASASAVAKHELEEGAVHTQDQTEFGAVFTSCDRNLTPNLLALGYKDSHKCHRRLTTYKPHA